MWSGSTPPQATCATPGRDNCNASVNPLTTHVWSSTRIVITRLGDHCVAQRHHPALRPDLICLTSDSNHSNQCQASRLGRATRILLQAIGRFGGVQDLPDFEMKRPHDRESGHGVAGPLFGPTVSQASGRRHRHGFGPDSRCDDPNRVSPWRRHGEPAQRRPHRGRSRAAPRP